MTLSISFESRSIIMIGGHMHRDIWHLADRFRKAYLMNRAVCDRSTGYLPSWIMSGMSGIERRTGVPGHGRCLSEHVHPELPPSSFNTDVSSIYFALGPIR